MSFCRVSHVMNTARRYHDGFRSGFMLLLCACLALVALTGCEKKKEAAATPPPTVEVVTVAPRDVPVSFDFIAQTESSQQVTINARVSGFLDKRVYTEGSMVKTGDVLFVMDKKPYQVQVDGAVAALARQKAAAETARLNLERTKPLAAQNALSQKDLDDATGNYESSVAAVEQAKSQLDTAKLNLSYCTITSPVTGITGAAQQQDGTYINLQNSQLTTVAVLSPIWVNFSVSENLMAAYRKQTAERKLIPPKGETYDVDVILVDGSLFSHSGRITFTAPSYDAKTGAFLIRASVANPGGLLRPNQYVRARLKGAVRPNAILVPQRAVQQGAKGNYVWVVNRDGKADFRPVAVGDWHGDDWFITDGLHAGDRVIVDGGLTLRAGTAVTVKPAGPAPDSTPKSAAPSGPATKTAH